MYRSDENVVSLHVYKLPEKITQGWMRSLDTEESLLEGFFKRPESKPHANAAVLGLRPRTVSPRSAQPWLWPWRPARASSRDEEMQVHTHKRAVLFFFFLGVGAQKSWL